MTDIAIRVQNLSKRYQIYDQPRDRLKQFVVPKLCRAFPPLRKVFPTPYSPECPHSPLTTHQGQPTPHSPLTTSYLLQRLLGAQRRIIRNQKRRNRRHHPAQWQWQIHPAATHLRHTVTYGRQRGAQACAGGSDRHKEAPMKKSFTPSVSTNCEVASLFERVAGILESGRGRVLRTINHETVLAYWLIGREIVQALQGGEARAQYGNALIADLSNRLTESYGAGFSVANLKNFRQFYLAYADRAVLICHPSCSQLSASD